MVFLTSSAFRSEERCVTNGLIKAFKLEIYWEKYRRYVPWMCFILL